MQAATRIPIYTRELMVGREAAPELVEGVLHAICFVRLLGLLHPRSEPVLGVEMPRVNDEATITRIQDTTRQLFRQLDNYMDRQEEHDKTCVDIVVSWHKPLTPGSERPSRASTPDRFSSSQPSSQKSYAVFQSPYSWMASALAGTRMSGNGRERDASRVLVLDATHESTDTDVFEQWVLGLHVDYTNVDSDTKHVESDLTEFLMTAMTFANEHQARIPPIIEAGLCPFPYTIDCTVRS